MQLGADAVTKRIAGRQDDVGRVESWAARGQLAPVSDDEARGWYRGRRSLWAVVVKPWVLVQEIS